MHIQLDDIHIPMNGGYFCEKGMLRPASHRLNQSFASRSTHKSDKSQKKRSSKMAIQRENLVVRSAFKFSVPVNFRYEFQTPSVIVGGVPWKIHFRKIFKQINPRVVGRVVVQAYLVCDYDEKLNSNKNWSITSGCILRMMKSIQSPQSIEPNISMQKFETEHRMNELKEFIFWHEMSDEKFDFLHDHQFRFEATIMTSPPCNIQRDPNSFDITSTTFGMKIEKIFDSGSVFSPTFKLRDIPWSLEFCKSKESLGINLHVMAAEYFGWSVSVNLIVKITSFDTKMNALEKSSQLRLVIGTYPLSIWKPFIGWHLKENCDAFSQLDNAYVQVTIDVGMWQPLFLADRSSKITQIKAKVSKCPICWVPFVDQEVVATGCGHLFCEACVRSALEVNGKCSFCNLRVVYLNP